MSSLELSEFYALGVILPNIESHEQASSTLYQSGFSGALSLSFNEHSSLYLLDQFFQNHCFFTGVLPILNKKDQFNSLDSIRNLKSIFHNNFRKPPTDHLLYQAFLKVKEKNLVYFSFPDNKDFSPQGEINEGQVSFELGLRGISTLNEELVVAKEIELARKTGAKLHFVQISTMRSIEMIAAAKKSGVNVTAGVGIGHLLFDETSLVDFNHNYKFLPPLRSQEDKNALIQAVNESIIDVATIGLYPSDPWHSNFSEAPFTSLEIQQIPKLIVQKLIEPGLIKIEKINEILSINPRKILGLEKSTNKMTINKNSYQIERNQ